MNTILIVDDSEDIHALVTQSLGRGIRIVSAYTLSEGIRALENEPFDLLILDVGLPDGDGFELCSMAREDPRTRDLPILFLTGRTDVSGKVMAFALGADDFIEKPFDARELRARVQARLRRSGVYREVLERGGIRIDLPRQRVELRGDAEGEYREVPTTPKEFKLLLELITNAERVLDRERLRQLVWHETLVCTRTIDTYVSQLRKKLGPAGSAIEAVRGVGYCFRPSGGA